MAQLKTLGGLEVEGVHFGRTKPLLLLAYLTLEGPQPRRHLAELFWQHGNRMKSLSMALTLLRQGAGEVVELETNRVKSVVSSDVRNLLGALEQNHWEQAASLYTGAFLDGVTLSDWGSELEEWVYETRERLAEQVQLALLNLAETAAKSRDFQAAKASAERAYKVPGLAGTEIAQLERLYPLLLAGESILAPEVCQELEGYGIKLQLTVAAARASFAPSSSQIPARGTSFIGRDVELTELATLFGEPQVSLLTLLGPAGVGKTRLALQFAHEQQRLGSFGSVWFVSLEALQDPNLIPARLLAQLGLAQQGNVAPVDQLGDFFTAKNCLLVLDNFEHVRAGAAFLPTLLQRCPELNILVTSRETLNLEEEHVYRLEGLPFSTNVADARGGDAVQLFTARARQLEPHFALEPNLTDVIRICQLVDALPLGIELAAGWVGALSCGEIAAEIEQGLGVLATSKTNVPERHRSLKAAFEGSWTRLSVAEQKVLRNLPVFRGGFRRDAAAAVAGATMPVLASLIGKSLLRFSPGGRYGFHPLLQQFAGEKLAAHPQEKITVTAKHSRYYAALLRDKRGDIPRSSQNRTTDTLAEEVANLERMWHFITDSIAEQHRLGDLSDEVATLATATFLLFYNLGRLAEGAKLFAEAKASLDSTNSEHFFALGSLGVREAGCLKYLARFRDAVLAAEASLSYLRRSSHPENWKPTITGLNEAGVSLYHLGQFERALTCYQEAINLATTHDDLRSAKVLESNLANILWHMGDDEKAAAVRRGVAEHYEARADWEEVAGQLEGLAVIQLSKKDFAGAKRLLERAVTLLEQHHVRSIPVLCDLSSSLGVAHGGLKNYAKAHRYHETSLTLAKETGSPLYEASALYDYAVTLTRMGDYAEVQKKLKTCLAILWAGHDRGRLLPALLAWAKVELAQGRPLQAAEIVDLVGSQNELAPKDRRIADEILADIKVELPEDELLRATARGERLELAHVVTTIVNEVSEPVSDAQLEFDAENVY